MGACNRMLDRWQRDASILHGIFPGTKWCGKGNIASGPKDFGKLVGLDACCMKHDQCPLSVLPGETKFGITNRGIYPISHCGCDDQLHSCLKGLSDDNAQLLDEIYFEVLRMKCFIKEYPRVCVRWYWWGSCKEFKEDRKSLPVVQLAGPRHT
ncbi:phospholipase A(2)-like [Watersipora subatra]|uniref:phospholipase A(2)-like n=1 Tax=Watersipora subatra TaxID=2589382 RepID=UPI00355BFB72